MYAVNTGLFVGEFFVYIRQSQESYHFLSLPKLIRRDIPKDKFELGVKDKIISLIEKLPGAVFEYCITAYDKVEKGLPRYK